MVVPIKVIIMHWTYCWMEMEICSSQIHPDFTLAFICVTRSSCSILFLFSKVICCKCIIIVNNFHSLNIWAALRKKVPNVLSHCHTKRRYDTDFLDLKKNWKFLKFFFFFWKVGVIPKEGWARPCAPVLLLVWQRLRIIGTFCVTPPNYFDIKLFLCTTSLHIGIEEYINLLRP